MNIREAEVLLDSPIAFHRAFAGIAEGALAGLWLSQVFYWTKKYTHRSGWFYCSHDDWREQIGITRSEVDTVRKRLGKDGLNLVEEVRKGCPGRIWTRINWPVFLPALERWICQRAAEAEAVHGKNGVELPPWPANRQSEEPAKHNSAFLQSEVQDARKAARSFTANSKVAIQRANTKSSSETTQRSNNTEDRAALRPTPDVVAFLASHGIKGKPLNELGSTCSIEQAKAAVRHLRIEQLRRPIDNPSGWLVKCLKEGYEPPQATASKAKDEAKDAERKRSLMSTSENKALVKLIETFVDGIDDDAFHAIAVEVIQSAGEEIRDHLLRNPNKSNWHLCERVYMRERRAGRT